MNMLGKVRNKLRNIRNRLKLMEQIEPDSYKSSDKRRIKTKRERKTSSFRTQSPNRGKQKEGEITQVEFALRAPVRHR